MVTLVRGQKLKLSDITHSTTLYIGIFTDAPSNVVVDVSCFGIDAQNNLSDDRYFIFYNQKMSPCGSIKSLGQQGEDSERFEVNLSQLPSSIHKLVFVITIDSNETMSVLNNSFLRIVEPLKNTEILKFQFHGSDFGSEKAVIVGEMYLKDIWRFSAVAQGFNGGLSALLKHFGGEEITPPISPSPLHRGGDSKTSLTSTSSASLVNTKKISLEKRIEKEAPQLVNLVKKAAISLKKVGLQDHGAKVALCLDVSGSMYGLYNSGAIQRFAERILALGCRFDDDGSIDIFLFADKACNAGEMKVENLGNQPIQKLVNSHNVGGGTSYGPALREIRKFYFQNKSIFPSLFSSDKRTSPLKAPLPVYVMFVTDGETSDESIAEEQIRYSSYEPIFWQFMAIGSGSFRFLKKLDTMSNRYVDNANFFSIDNPDSISDEALYDLLMTEYPSWVKQAKVKSLIP